MLRRKGSIKFQGRQHSKKGMISLLLGILVIGVFLTISFISGSHKGNGALILGAIGMICFVISIIGFIIGVKSFKEKDIFYVSPVAGVGSNGIMMIVLFILYIVGIVV